MRLISIVFVIAMAACGHGPGDVDETIGAACASDRECDSLCFRGGDYPGGFCSNACQSDRDCTEDAFCIDEDGGVCLFLCPEFDCDKLGPGWQCKEKDRAGGGKISVCIGG